MKPRIIDLSHPLSTSTPPWPGCAVIELSWLDRAGRTQPGDRHTNSSRFAMNVHCGTHMDAPYHFFDQGWTIDRVPLERTYGPATLIDLCDKGPGSQITPSDLQPWEAAVRRTRKAILRTGWATRWKTAEFFSSYPGITTEAAEWLVDCGAELVGVETPSIDYPPNDAHVSLLGKDVLIIENLTQLDQIPAGEFLFSATPLNLEGRDGSPVRAIAILSE